MLANAIRKRLCEAVIFYDPIRGFRAEALNPEDRAVENALLETLGLSPADGAASAGIDLFRTTLARIVSQRERRAALVVDYGSLMANRIDALSREEHLLLSQALIASHSARPSAGPDGVGIYTP